MKRSYRLRALELVVFFGMTRMTAAAAPVVIPLTPGLTLVQAVSERQRDYESILNVEDLDADGVLHLTASADLPDPAGGKPDPVSFNRDVSSIDRDQARTYKSRRANSSRYRGNASRDLGVRQFRAARHQYHAGGVSPLPAGRTHPSINGHSRTVHPFLQEHL